MAAAAGGLDLRAQLLGAGERFGARDKDWRIRWPARGRDRVISLKAAPALRREAFELGQRNGAVIASC
jgi:hypothetical protein